MLESKKESKLSKNRAKKQKPHWIAVCPLLNLCFMLKESFLISPKHITYLHDRTALLSFWKTEVIAPKTAGRTAL